MTASLARLELLAKAAGQRRSSSDIIAVHARQTALTVAAVAVAQARPGQQCTCLGPRRPRLS